MYLILLGSLSFILFQIIRSKVCEDFVQDELMILSLSNYEVIQIPINELIYPSSTLILCDYNGIHDIRLVEGIQIIQKVNHLVDDEILLLKQYKNSKNRMPRQSSMVIAQANYIQLVNFYWGKEPKFDMISDYQKKAKLVSLDLMEKSVMINKENESSIYEIFPKISLKSPKDRGCQPPEITDQLDEIIFSISHHLIKAHNDWYTNTVCSDTKIEFESQDQIKNDITTFKIYPTQIITFISDEKLFTLDLQSKKTESKLQQKILDYDYDMIKKKFVIVNTEQLEYDGQISKLNFEGKKTQVLLTKSFIIFRYGLTIQIFSKKLILISTKTFTQNFEIVANQLQDQFILVDNTYLQRFLLYENSFLEINTKQSNQINLIQNINDKEGLKNIQLVIQSDYDMNHYSLNINQTKEVSTIFHNKLINFQQCNDNQFIMGPQQFYHYNKLLIIFSHKVRVFDLDSFKIIFAFSSSYLYLGIIQNTNLNQFIKYSIQDEVITKSNCAFQIQDDKINYIHCAYLCYIYFDIVMNYDQKKIEKINKIEKNQVLKVVSDNNHFYLLTSNHVQFFNLTERQISQIELLVIEDPVQDIFASPKKKDYLFVLTKTGTLHLYSISLPFQDLISIFQLDYYDLIDFIIFEHYFLIFIKQHEKVKCKVYNYKNELNIFLQRYLPLDYFQQINFEDLQVDYDQNILYVKGQLIKSNEFVIIAYRIDTRIELSIQFISKVKDQFGFLLPISNRMILRYQNKFNFTAIFHNGDKETSCLITKFLKDDDEFMNEDESFSDSESDIDSDDTLSLDDSYHFSTSSFISISSAGELLILGMQSIYGRKRAQNIDLLQPL